MKKAKKLKHLIPAIFLLFLSVVLVASVLTKPMGNDEGMWSYMGRIWIENDMPPYKYSVENKTPGIYILHALSHQIFGIGYLFVRCLGIISIVVSSYLLYRIATRLHNHFAGLLSMLVFGLTMVWTLMDGSYAGQTETFMVLFTIAGFFCLLKNQHANHPIKWIFATGFFMGLAIAFKQVAVLTCIPIFCFLLFRNGFKKFSFLVFKPALLFSFGILAATASSILPLLMEGVSLEDYIEGAWLILLKKGSTVPMDLHIANLQSAWTTKRIISFYPLLIPIVYVLIKKKEQLFNLLATLLLFDFIAVNLSGNYYGHQFKQLLPTLSLCTAISMAYLVDLKYKKGKRVLKAGLVLLAGFYYYPYLQNINLGVKKIARCDFEIAAPSKKIGKWIKNNTRPNDYIYTPNYHYNAILSYSERVSSSEYFNFIFVNGKKQLNEVVEDLHQKPPRLIIGKMPADNSYESVKKLMREKYRKINTLNGIPIFEKKKPPN